MIIGEYLICKKSVIEIFSFLPFKTFKLKKGNKYRIDNIKTDKGGISATTYIKIDSYGWLSFSDVERYFYLNEKDIRLAKLKKLK